MCDGRSDVYGLGLTLYELLALRPAFDASDREGLFYQVDQVEPPAAPQAQPGDPRGPGDDRPQGDREGRGRIATPTRPSWPRTCGASSKTGRSRPAGSARRSASTRWARRNPGLASLGTALAGMLALVVAVIVLADLRLRRQHEETETNLRRAELAEGDAVGKLLDSYVANARAGRRSRFAGRRFEGLRAIRAAAALDRPGDRRLELRNEAIACLALPDLRPVRDAGKTDRTAASSGSTSTRAHGRMARGTPAGDVLVRERRPTGRLMVRLPGNGLRVVTGPIQPRRPLPRREARGARTRLSSSSGTRGEPRNCSSVPDGVYGDAVEFHPDGRTLAAGRRDGSIVLYDLDRRREIRRLPPGPVPHSIRFDPTGSESSSSSARARGWHPGADVKDGIVTAAGPCPSRRTPWNGTPTAAGWRSEASSAGSDCSTCATRRGTPERFKAHDGAVVALAFHPRGRLLASASWDGTLRTLGSPVGRGACAMPAAGGSPAPLQPGRPAPRPGARRCFGVALGSGRGRRVPIAGSVPTRRRGEAWSLDFLAWDGRAGLGGCDGRAACGSRRRGGGVRRPARDRRDSRGSRRFLHDHQRSDRSAPLASPALASELPPGRSSRAVRAAGRPSHRAGSPRPRRPDPGRGRGRRGGPRGHPRPAGTRPSS